MDVAQALEDLLEELLNLQKAVNKLKTKSVSGSALRKQIKELHKRWLPVLGVLETGNLVDAGQLQDLAVAWKRLAKLTEAANPKAQYKPVLKLIIATTEGDLLHSYIKGSAIQTIGATLRKMVQPVSDPALLKYLDESILCAEAKCVKASVVLAWCAVAHTVHRRLLSLGLPQLQAEFDKMRQASFKRFKTGYAIATEPDVQEISDRHLILLCRFLAYFDDTQHTRILGALDLRNGCGHPTGYEPDPVNLQSFYSDITQLILLNPKFA